MEIIKATGLSKEQKEKIRHLWNLEYPQQLMIDAVQLDDYLQKSENHHHILILDKDETLIGWAYSFDRDDERWFSILVDRRFQKQGYGRMLLNLLKENESRLNGWVIDHPRYSKSSGEPYISPLPFYLVNGFRVCSETRYEDEKLSAVKMVWIKP